MKFLDAYKEQFNDLRFLSAPLNFKEEFEIRIFITKLISNLVVFDNDKYSFYF